MEFFNIFQFIPYHVVIMFGFIVIPVLFIWTLIFMFMLIRIFNYTEIDKKGRRYRRNFFFPGRICPGCRLKVFTEIPTCPSCDRVFSKGSEDIKCKDY